MVEHTRKVRYVECPVCKGRGTESEDLSGDPCTRCGGYGRVPDEEAQKSLSESLAAATALAEENPTET